MNYNPFSLTGKTIVVTGASSGIGRSCAIECSRAGARVLLLGRNVDRLRSTLDEMINHDLNHLVYSLDITNYEEVDRLLQQVLDQSIRIHGLVHCAGVSSTTSLRSFQPEKLAQMVSINVTSALYLTKGFTQRRMMPESGQSIVFISSVMGVVGETAKAMYSATKGAINAASRSLAVELAPKNIRVNVISPGVVITPMSSSAPYSRSEESLSEVLKLHPLGLGTPDDVAYACVYLLSNASCWVTGANLMVDGGYSAR